MTWGDMRRGGNMRSNQKHEGGVVDRWLEQFPLLPFFGFAFWIAWNLIAFFGIGWYDGTENTWTVFDLTNTHLTASFVTLVTFYICSKRVSDFIKKPRSMALGGALAVIGAVLIVLSGPLFFPSFGMFVTGAVCAGVGTTFMFVRSAGFFSALIPRVTFIRICEALLAAVCISCVIMIAPKAVAKVLFILVPACSALLLASRSYEPAELRVVRDEPSSLRRYGSFLLAVVVFSTAAQFLQQGFFPATREDSLMSVNTTMLLLIVMAICFMLIAASMDNFGFGGIFLPAMLVIIALLVSMPMIEAVLPISLSASISSAALYSCNILVWGVAAYAVFQSQRNAVKIFCSANAALVIGSLVGNALILAVTSDASGVSFIPTCIILGLAAIIVIVFIFPEKKLEAMFIPIDESSLNASEGPPSTAASAPGSKHAPTSRRATGCPNARARCSGSSRAARPTSKSPTCSHCRPTPSAPTRATSTRNSTCTRAASFPISCATTSTSIRSAAPVTRGARYHSLMCASTRARAQLSVPPSAIASGLVTGAYETGNCQCVSIWSGSKAARCLVEQRLGGTVSADWFGDSEWDASTDVPIFSNQDEYDQYLASGTES